ncbi:MAG TPA: dihydrodipicolinate synthase family protein [Chthoniobacteraceae bacterium]|nr:dihydrodipicolinate synthase family protein [Chthoniobacteraceae bacterium]
MSKNIPLTGLVAAPFSPFDSKGTLNLRLVEKLAASLATNGVAGAFVCGTTGEGLSLTTAERMSLAQRWISVAGDTVRIIVHVGHTSLADCRALASHAEKIGAWGIGCFAPFFFKPAHVEDLVSFCAEVAAAAPSLPFYYYHIPAMTGVEIPVAQFLRAARNRIPTLAGAKFTHENLMDYAESAQIEDGRYDLLLGRDELLLPGLALGVGGAIGTTYNFAAPVYQKIIAAFQRGDLAGARVNQARANAMISVLMRHGMLPAGKAIMKMIGLDCGPVRLPLRSPSDLQQSHLREDLERVGFFEFCSMR